MRRATLWFFVVVLALVPTVSQAGQFAVVYADTLNLTLHEGSNGIHVLAYSWALVVNTGDSPITSEDWSGVPNSYRDSDECMNIVGLTSSDPTPILPGEAIGRIIVRNNVLLLDGLEASEELRAGYRQQFMSIQLEKYAGTSCAGQLQYEVEWGVAGEMVQLDFVVNLEIGTPDLEFVSFKRVESSPTLSASAVSTFGGIKAVYR